MSHHILKLHKLSSPSEVKEFFENLESLSGEILEEVKIGKIPKDEIGFYLNELQEVINLLENIKNKF